MIHTTAPMSSLTICLNQAGYKGSHFLIKNKGSIIAPLSLILQSSLSAHQGFFPRSPPAPSPDSLSTLLLMRSLSSLLRQCRKCRLFFLRLPLRLHVFSFPYYSNILNISLTLLEVAVRPLVPIVFRQVILTI